MKTQKDQIKDHLVQYRSITSWTAITQYRITRLAEYIRQLKEEMNIRTENKTQDGKTFAVYHLDSFGNVEDVQLAMY